MSKFSEWWKLQRSLLGIYLFLASIAIPIIAGTLLWIFMIGVILFNPDGCRGEYEPPDDTDHWNP